MTLRLGGSLPGLAFLFKVYEARFGGDESVVVESLFMSESEILRRHGRAAFDQIG